MVYDCRDISGFLEAILMWIHPIHQNQYRTQWLRVGNNIDYPGGGGVHDLRMDGGLPPGFQKGTLF